MLCCVVTHNATMTLFLPKETPLYYSFSGPSDRMWVGFRLISSYRVVYELISIPRSRALHCQSVNECYVIIVKFGCVYAQFTQKNYFIAGKSAQCFCFAVVSIGVDCLVCDVDVTHCFLLFSFHFIFMEIGGQCFLVLVVDYFSTFLKINQETLVILISKYFRKIKK